ncbi:hypothetical protein H101_06199 [Trichophyton interdigitale H6]|nr:hypothetical protein H101_06199 [Trichophyton interdigitale H6]
MQHGYWDESELDRKKEARERSEVDVRTALWTTGSWKRRLRCCQSRFYPIKGYISQLAKTNRPILPSFRRFWALEGAQHASRSDELDDDDEAINTASAAKSILTVCDIVNRRAHRSNDFDSSGQKPGRSRS